MVDQTVSNLQSGGMASQADAISALLAYSLQIFFDFSSYSEMAIGIAWMFGVQLPVNFNSPYKASSLIDFWRRWRANAGLRLSLPIEKRRELISSPNAAAQ